MKKMLVKWFLQPYLELDDQSRFQAFSLALILIGMVLITLLIGAVLEDTQDKLMLFSMSLVTFLLLFGLRTGRANLIGIITIAFLSLGTVGLILSNSLYNFLIIYMLAYLQIFVMALSLLITNRSIHSILVMVIGVSTIIGIHLFRVAQSAIEPRYEVITPDDPIIACSLLLFTGFIIIGSNRRGRSLFESIRSEGEKNQKHATYLTSVVDDLQSDFNTGTRLVESSGNMKTSVEELSGMMDTIGEEMNRVVRAAGELHDAGESVRSVADGVNQSSETQTAIIEETSAAITEMASSIDHISRIAEDRKTVVTNLFDSAGSAEAALSESNKAMKNLTELIRSLTEVSKVISDIAQQTGLLAMNAAIEAAHAGESGRGFAVVAGEVRKLSDNATTNVRSITDMLKEVSDAVEHAVSTNSTVSATFHDMRTKITMVVQGMDEILSGVSELAKGTAEINTGTAQSVSATQDVRNSIVSLTESIQGISSSIELQRTSTGSVMQTLEKANTQLVSVNEESGTVAEIGNESVENLRDLKKKLEGAEKI
jgi:methyl-accepting chemotaxis protein